MSSFTDEDAGMVVTSMEISPNKNLLAVAGALENDWAVRVYSLSSNGPEQVGEWTAAEKKNSHFPRSYRWHGWMEPLHAGLST